MASSSASSQPQQPPEKSKAELEAEMLAAAEQVFRKEEDAEIAAKKERIKKLTLKEKAAKLAAKKAAAKARRPPPRIPGPGKKGWKMLQTVEWPPGVDPHSLDLKNATYYKHPDVDLLPPSGVMSIADFERAKWERDSKLAAARGEALPAEPASMRKMTEPERIYADVFAEAVIAGKPEPEARQLAAKAQRQAELKAIAEDDARIAAGKVAQNVQNVQSVHSSASTSGETPEPQTPTQAPQQASAAQPSRVIRPPKPTIDPALADKDPSEIGISPEEVHARVAARIALGRKIFPNTYLGFYAYYQFMTADRGFAMPKHLTHVAMALLDDRIKNLLVIIGPGSGKSSLLSVLYPAFVLGQDPTQTILGISAGEALMQGFQSTVMEWIESHPGYRQCFPGVVPDKDRGWSTDRGLFVRGHAQGDPDASYFAVGLTSKALTGKHARIIIGDDLHDKENSATAEACLRVRETYYRQIIGRADPRGARFIFAGRRWHEEDIYGHLKSTGEWVVMELPAVRKNSTQLYWDVTIPEGLHCCFNEPVQQTSILGDAGAAAAKAAG